MDLQDRYDELDNIITNIDKLISDITDEDYIAELKETKSRAEDELKEVEEKLEEENNQDKKQLEKEYWESRF